MVATKNVARTRQQSKKGGQTTNNSKRVVKAAKVNQKASNATASSAKRAVRVVNVSNKISNGKATTGNSKNGRVVLKANVPKKKPKNIVFPGQEKLSNKAEEVKKNKPVKVSVPATSKAPTKAPKNGIVAISSSSSKASAAAGVHTAEAIARDITHPKREEVNELLKAFNRKWIDAKKFNEVLRQTLF